MATTTQIAPIAGFAAAERTFDGFLAAAARTIAAYRTYRRTLAELRSLDAHSRADIGMGDRSPEAFARAAVYGAD